MKQKRQGKCTKEIIEKCCILVGQGCSWVKIAKVLDLGRTALFLWRDEASQYYNKKFDDAVKAALEARDTGRIKANQFIEADRHILTKTIRELKIIDKRTLKSKMRLPPPAMPPSNLRKREIIRYAKDFLGIRIDEGLTINDMRMICAKRIADLSIEVMVKVKEEEQQMPANQQAVKNVLTNAGPKNSRWNFKDEVEVSGDLTIENVVFGKPENGKKPSK